MKKIEKFILVLCCFFFFMNTTMGQDISDFKWKNRVLMLVSDDVDNEILNTQLEILNKSAEAFKERDLILFIITPKNTFTSNKTSVNLKGIAPYQKNNFEGVILLGKDGGVKLKEPFTVSSKTILNLIDSMPMRRGEMKSQ